MKHEEDILQAKCFQWAWNEHPHTRGLLFHVPNGGLRGKREANRLKAIGVVPGIPDLILLWDERAYGFELKSEKGTTSKDQKKIHSIWAGQSIDVCIVYHLDQFKDRFLDIVIGST